MAELTIEQILEEYISKVQQIQALVTNPHYPDKRNILNILEYMRIMHSFENIREGNSFTALRIGTLSQSSVSQVFLGKGVCLSQTRLMRDILPDSIKLELLEVFYMDEDNIFVVDQHSVIIIPLDGNLCYVDPTLYTGDKDRLEGSKNTAQYGRRSFESITATEDEIGQSRREIQSKLIQMLQIDKISGQIITPDMTDLQKHCAIFAFIESIINVENTDVDFYTANLFGHNIEVGKLMELFFAANDIDYTIECGGNRFDSVYTVKLDGETTHLHTTEMYYARTTQEGNKHIRKTLHYTPGPDGKLEYLFNRPGMAEQYISAMASAREKVRNIVLGTPPRIAIEDIGNVTNGATTADVKDIESALRTDEDKGLGGEVPVISE